MLTLVLISCAVAGFSIAALAVAAACSSGSAYGDCCAGGDECGAAFGLDL